jgi:hypothetical protein
MTFEKELFRHILGLNFSNSKNCSLTEQ